MRLSFSRVVVAHLLRWKAPSGEGVWISVGGIRDELSSLAGIGCAIPGWLADRLREVVHPRKSAVGVGKDLGSWMLSSMPLDGISSGWQFASLGGRVFLRNMALVGITTGPPTSKIDCTSVPEWIKPCLRWIKSPESMPLHRLPRQVLRPAPGLINLITRPAPTTPPGVQLPRFLHTFSTGNTPARCG
ncbi:hypothetical protein C4D60_Mb00t19970 [Musa balbisiana]|uniref:Uncharacterized protein n=1 Tax=Musa balbisiana TaxID=52838 RepID=A0A4S8I4R4_MUSBA|nr:hypothetical protein C4D60_Mb00t19970 [Musa balbisiana]